jgi:HSP20 family molecular chaperone IbpA
MAGDLGIDVSKELDRLRLCMDSEMTNIHRDMFRLMPGSPTAPVQSITAGDSAVSTSTTTTSQQQVTGGDFGDFLVKMDPDAIRSCIDKAHDDRVKLNFDVQEFDSETINIKTVGNKIEVHATKKSKKGDEERSEEFTRVYELPTQNDVDPTKVTSSIYKDGVLTIELPVADALGDSKQ